ncbi:MAG: 4-phosphopantetheinyl transferase family protein [Cyclobacteriaceae bacterium]
MVGIDIVDHSDPLLRKRDERAFRLIRNQDDLHSSNNLSLENLFWLYWSAKEATYKTHRKRVRFDPKKIPIQLRQEKNKYSFVSEQIEGFIIQNPHYTLAVCSKIDSKEFVFKIFNINTKDQSATIRSLMIENIKEETGFDAISNSDKMGLPYVEFNGKKHLSTFTHHHSYVGFIYQK